MTKRDLIMALAERPGMSQKRAEQVVNTIFDGMADALIDGERVEVRGLGSFEVRHYGSYKGRNPKTGEAIFVAPKRLPFFKPGKELAERVNRGPYELVDAARAPGQSNGRRPERVDPVAPDVAATDTARERVERETPPNRTGDDSREPAQLTMQLDRPTDRGRESAKPEPRTKRPARRTGRPHLYLVKG